MQYLTLAPTIFDPISSFVSKCPCQEQEPYLNILEFYAIAITCLRFPFVNSLPSIFHHNKMDIVEVIFPLTSSQKQIKCKKSIMDCASCKESICKQCCGEGHNNSIKYHNP